MIIKLIILMILSFLIIGCKSYDNTQHPPTQPTQQAIGGGCGVIEDEYPQLKVKSVRVARGL